MENKKKTKWYHKLFGFVIGVSLFTFIIFGAVWLAIKAIKAVINLF